jgi:hypothetical protein
MARERARACGRELEGREALHSLGDGVEICARAEGKGARENTRGQAWRE